MQKNKIGFIGIGVMGKSMADNLFSSMNKMPAKQ